MIIEDMKIVIRIVIDHITIVTTRGAMIIGITEDGTVITGTVIGINKNKRTGGSVACTLTRS